MNPHSGARSGTTLLEMVVALAVTGIALAAGYGAFAALADARDAAGRDTARIATAAAQRQQIVDWLASAQLTAADDDVVFTGLDRRLRTAAGNVDDDGVAFLAASGANGAEAGIRIYIDRDDRTAERGLVAEVATRSGAAPSVQRLELAPGATSLSVEHLSAAVGRPRWLPVWSSDAILPSAVRIRIGGDSVPALLALPITVPLGAGR